MAANTGLQYGGGLQFSGVGQTVVPQQPIMMNLPSVQQSELQEQQQNLQNLQFAGVQQQQPINLGYAQQTVPITMPATFQQPILSSSFAAPIVQQQLPIVQQASWVQQPINLAYTQQQQPINLAYTQQQPIMQQQFPINLQASTFTQQPQLQMPVMQSAVSTVMPAYGGQSALSFLSPWLLLSRRPRAGCPPFLPAHSCCALNLALSPYVCLRCVQVLALWAPRRPVPARRPPWPSPSTRRPWSCLRLSPSPFCDPMPSPSRSCSSSLSRSRSSRRAR